MWTRSFIYGEWTDWVQLNTLHQAEITANSQILGIGTNYKIVELNTNVSDYMPNSLFVEDNKIKTRIKSAAKFQAQITVSCQLDGLCTIRLRKNGTSNVASTSISMKSGETYTLFLQKLQNFDVNDYFELTSNGGTNTGGVNTIDRINLIVEQNII